MKKVILSFILILMFLIVITGCAQQVVDDDDDMDDVDDDNEVEDDDVEDIEESVPDVTFVITGENFKFVMDGVDNPDLVVNEGDLVRIEFTSTEGFHDWVVDELGEATKRADSGESNAIEFVANKKGTFDYYCSVGSHREKGMFGKITVN